MPFLAFIFNLIFNFLNAFAYKLRKVIISNISLLALSLQLLESEVDKHKLLF